MNWTQFLAYVYEVDGIEYRGLFSFIIVSSANRISGINNFYKDVKLDDNKFEVLLCKLTSKPELVKSLFYLRNNNDLDNIPGCEYYELSDLTIEFDSVPTHSWGIDGEEYKSKEKVFHFTINKEINVVLPRNSVDKLFVETKDNEQKVMI